jgi:hypothetical protein
MILIFFIFLFFKTYNMKSQINVFPFLLFFILIVLSCKKNEEAILIQPPPLPQDTTYSLKVFDGNTLILSDTIKRGWHDSLNISWEFKGKMSFEIRHDDNHLTYDTVGKKNFLLLENNLTLSFLKKGIIFKQLVIIVEENQNPILVLSFSNDSLPYRGTADILYSFVGDSCVVSDGIYNHRLTANPATFNTGVLNQTTTFSFTAYKKGNSLTADAVFNVALPTNMYYISAHPWTMEFCQWKYYEQDPWTPSGIFAGEKYVYHNYGWMETFDPKGVLIGNGPFTINETALFRGTNNVDHWPIVELDDTVMILRHMEECGGAPVDSLIVQYTYKPWFKK